LEAGDKESYDKYLELAQKKASESAEYSKTIQANEDRAKSIDPNFSSNAAITAADTAPNERMSASIDRLNAVKKANNL